MEKDIAKKYDQLLSRSFEKDLSTFLFKCFIDGNKSNTFIIDNYQSFIPEEELINAYTAIHQLSKLSDKIEGTEISVGEFDKFLKDWFDDNIQLIKDFKATFSYRFIAADKFYEFYTSDKKKCAYCDISEKQIKKLIEKKRIYTKTLFNRGRSLEIDRKNSFKSYERDNIVFCCYWCNNAKTDEFSEDEFKLIGEQIKLIWLNRLKENF